MNLRLQNRVVLVADYGGEGVPALMQLLEAEGAVCLRISCVDLSEGAGQVSRIGEQYGRIDGLIHSLPANDRVGLEQGDYVGFMRSLEWNIGCLWRLTQAALPFLARGVIINCIAQAAETGKGGSSGYAAGNGGRIGLTTGWSLELRERDIRVNGVVVADGAGPLGPGTWEEIAGTVVFLLSPAGIGVRGELVYVDGGYVHLAREI